MIPMQFFFSPQTNKFLQKGKFHGTLVSFPFQCPWAMGGDPLTPSILTPRSPRHPPGQVPLNKLSFPDPSIAASKRPRGTLGPVPQAPRLGPPKVKPLIRTQKRRCQPAGGQAYGTPEIPKDSLDLWQRSGFMYCNMCTFPNSSQPQK